MVDAIQLTAAKDFGTLITIIIGLAAVMVATHIFTITRKYSLDKIEKEIKGTEFIKSLKKKLMFDYSFWMKISIFFMVVSVLIFGYALYKIASIIWQFDQFNPNYNFAGLIFLSIATTAISILISLIVFFNRSKIEEYKDITKIKDIPKIPPRFKDDLIKISKLWNKSDRKMGIKNEELKDEIIHAVSNAISQEEAKKK